MRPAAGRGTPGELRAFMRENPGSRSPHVGPVYLDGPTCHPPLIPSTQDCQVPARSLVVQGFWDPLQYSEWGSFHIPPPHASVRSQL